MVSALWPVDFEDADVVLAHEALDAAAARHLVEGDLLLHHFVGGVDEGLQHVDLLFDLPHQLFDPFRSGADDDRELMDARQRRLGGREALDIDVAAGENRGDLVQQTHFVFRKYGDDILLFFHCSFGFYSSRIAATGAPAGTMGNTLSSPSTRTSSRYAPRQACISAMASESSPRRSTQR